MCCRCFVSTTVFYRAWIWSFQLSMRQPKPQTTDIPYRSLFRAHGNVAYGQIQIENYKVVFFGDLLVYKINSLNTF